MSSKVIFGVVFVAAVFASFNALVWNSIYTFQVSQFSVIATDQPTFPCSIESTASSEADLREHLNEEHSQALAELNASLTQKFTQEITQLKQGGFVQQKTKIKSAAKFVFFIGLEGTGHHLMRAFLEGAPVMQRLAELNVYPSVTSQLQAALYNKHTGKSLFQHSRCMQTNVTENFGRVVELLQTINDKLVNEHQITVPANTLATDYSGMM
jgi:hypothetical protein